MTSRGRSASIPFTASMASWMFKRQAASKKAAEMANERWLTLKLKPKGGRPKSKYLKESRWWPVQYLGTVEAVKDWTAPGSRSELLEFIERAQDGLQSISSKGGPPKLLWISDQWIHVTDQARKKVYALSRTEAISSFCHATEVEGDHFLAMKILNPKTKRNDCVVIASHDITIIQYVSEALKVSIESALARNQAKIHHLMSLSKKGSKSAKQKQQEQHSYEKVASGRHLPPSTARFLDAEAKAMEYDVPSSRRSSPPYSLNIRAPSEISSSASFTSDYGYYADYDSQTTPVTGHYQTPRSSASSSLSSSVESPDSGYCRMARSTSVPSLPQRLPRSTLYRSFSNIPKISEDDVDYPAAYEEMNVKDDNVKRVGGTVIPTEMKLREEISNSHNVAAVAVESPTASDEEIYEPLEPQYQTVRDQDDDSGMEDNDSGEIHVKPVSSGKPRTHYSKIVRHFAAGDCGDLYAVVDKGNVNYEEEREEFLDEARKCIGEVRFREFQDIIALYDNGEADLAAMARRARLLFRGARWHMRQEMVKLIRPDERTAYLNEMSKRCSFTGADDLLSSLKKKKDEQPRRHVRFGFIRTKQDSQDNNDDDDADATNDEMTDECRSPSPTVVCPASISEWSANVIEELQMMQRSSQYDDGTARRRSVRGRQVQRKKSSDSFHGPVSL